jgi:hypothetical protein
MSAKKEKNIVVVDGSNLATEGRQEPSLKQLREMLSVYKRESNKAKLVVVVDASFEHRIAENERAQYESMVTSGDLIVPPAGTVGRGDAFILAVAAKAGAKVLSNDSFQEFHEQHPWVFEEGRLIGGKPVPNVGWIFVERTPVRPREPRKSHTTKPRSEQTVQRERAKRATRRAAENKPAAAQSRPETPPNKNRGRTRGKRERNTEQQ